MNIAGPSGSDKSELVEQWLRYLHLFQVKPQTRVYCYDRWQPRFERMQKLDAIQFHRGLPDPGHLTKWSGKIRGSVLVLDDLMAEGGGGKINACWIYSPKIRIIETSPSCI